MGVDNKTGIIFRKDFFSVFLSVQGLKWIGRNRNEI